MVDKIGWTEPLCSERDALEFLAKRGGRRTRWRAVVGGWRGRLSINARTNGLVGVRNHYDRQGMAGQRQGLGRGMLLRGG